MPTLNKTVNKTNTNDNKVTYIQLTPTTSVQFRPNSNFKDISSDMILKILTAKSSVNLRTSNPTPKGYINFNLGNGTVMFGHINLYKNDLTATSTDEEKAIVVNELHNLLRNVSLENIRTTLSETEVTDIINDLV